MPMVWTTGRFEAGTLLEDKKKGLAKCPTRCQQIQSKLCSGVNSFTNYCVIIKNNLQNFTIHPFLKTIYSQISSK